MPAGTGKIDLGLSASLSRAALSVDYAQHFARTRAGDLSAFATGALAYTRAGGSWRPDASLAAGVRLTW